MVLLYPLVLVAAIVIWKKKQTAASRGGWEWFAAWAVAGALLTFSFLTGFSIGLFFLPLAAAVVFWVARRAPGLFDPIGFVGGIGLTLLLVAVVNSNAGRAWLFAGLALGFGAVAAYRAAPGDRA